MGMQQRPLAILSRICDNIGLGSRGELGISFYKQCEARNS